MAKYYTSVVFSYDLWRLKINFINQYINKDIVSVVIKQDKCAITYQNYNFFYKNNNKLNIIIENNPSQHYIQLLNYLSYLGDPLYERNNFEHLIMPPPAHVELKLVCDNNAVNSGPLVLPVNHVTHQSIASIHLGAIFPTFQ